LKKTEKSVKSALENQKSACQLTNSVFLLAKSVIVGAHRGSTRVCVRGVDAAAAAAGGSGVVKDAFSETPTRGCYVFK
jgi:hypothetical protein